MHKIEYENIIEYVDSFHINIIKQIQIYKSDLSKVRKIDVRWKKCLFFTNILTNHLFVKTNDNLKKNNFLYKF